MLQDAAMRNVLAILILSVALSSCGNGYMLYETRYIPEPGERLTHEEFGQLPWHEPALDSNLTEHTPTRGPYPRFQTPGLHQVKRGTRNFHHAGDSSGHGHLSRDRAENADETVPASSAAD